MKNLFIFFFLTFIYVEVFPQQNQLNSGGDIQSDKLDKDNQKETESSEITLYQANSISGNVSDAETGEPLVGVNVVVEGTTTGTVTDLDGNFSLGVERTANVSLSFSFIGYLPEVIPISDQTEVSISLVPDLLNLDEVVVVGYGTQKKADLTGAISSVVADDIMNQPASNAIQAIQGKISGVNIINNDEPGSSPTIIVRGMGTALGGRDPLYIVDGFPVDDLTNISASDIVSMDVLKDASSASIYGVRAANGVVLITTKSGKKGNTKVNVNSNFGIKQIKNKVQMADADQYIVYFNEVQDALNEDWTLSTNQEYNTDWFDELTDIGTFNNQSLSLSGGSETVDYYLSFNYYGEDGILDENTYQRTTLNNNNVYKAFKDRVKIKQSLNLSVTKANPKPYSALDEAYRQSPLVPVKYENGRYGQPFVNTSTGVVGYEGKTGESIGSLNSIGNPVFTIDNTNELDKTFSVRGGLEAEIKITKFLKFNSRVGATKYRSYNRDFTDIQNAWLNADPTRTLAEFDTLKANNEGVTTYADNSLAITEVETTRWIWENYFSFNKDFGRNHLEATLGGSKEKTGIGYTFAATGYDVPEKSQYWNVDLASDDYEKEITQTSYTPTALMSFFGRAQYNYDNKYYLTATVRRDGSSTFKENGDYWGIFPSVGLGWTLSNEKFLSGNELIDFLKLRASWGKLGNQDVPLNVSQTLSSTGSSSYNYVFGSNQDLVYGAAFGTPAKDISWEVTEEWSAGVDFTLLDSKLSGSIDYYYKNNTNAILNVSTTLDSEYEDSYYDHGAEVHNSGIEFSFNWADKITNDLSYDIGVNYSFNKNKVVNVKSAYDGATGGSLSNGEVTKRLKEGQPIYSWWMFEMDGVFQNEDEIDNSPTYGSPVPGYLKYKDQNDDGLIDSRDKKYFGSYIPTSNFSLHLGLDYKNFDFNIDGYGVAGNKVYNALKGVRIDGGENISYDTYKNRWTGDGSTNSDPGAARDSYASNYYLEDGSFFRINNITLGYTIKDLFNNTNSIRIYCTAQNPFIFTKYTGFSPELSSDGDPSGTSGIELSAYPSTRNILCGVNIQF